MSLVFISSRRRASTSHIQRGGCATLLPVKKFQKFEDGKMFLECGQKLDNMTAALAPRVLFVPNNTHGTWFTEDPVSKEIKKVTREQVKEDYEEKAGSRIMEICIQNPGTWQLLALQRPGPKRRKLDNVKSEFGCIKINFRRLANYLSIMSGEECPANELSIVRKEHKELRKG